MKVGRLLSQQLLGAAAPQRKRNRSGTLPMHRIPSVALAGAVPSPAIGESSLVARCLLADQSAWYELYDVYSPKLCRVVGLALGPKGNDPDIVEEIVARVWSALVGDGARLLGAYAPDRSVPLDRYLAGIARCYVRRHVRAETQRRRHDRQCAVRMRVQLRPAVPGLDWGVLLNDFGATLNPSELDFLESYLLSPSKGGNGGLSAANIRQRRHRLRIKLNQFLRGSDD